MNRRLVSLFTMVIGAILCSQVALAVGHDEIPETGVGGIAADCSTIDSGFVGTLEDRSNDRTFVATVEDISNDAGFFLPAGPHTECDALAPYLPVVPLPTQETAEDSSATPQPTPSP